MVHIGEKSKYYKKSVYCEGIRVYNALPSNYKSITKSNSFKHKLKHFLLCNCFYSLTEYFDFMSTSHVVVM